MKHFVVFGNPITHSRSPYLFNAFFLNKCLPARYSPCLLELGQSPVQILKKHLWAGANVTVPFKETAFEDCDEVRGIAQEIGSVNTLVIEEGCVVGYNTDAEGFFATLPFIPKNVLLIGAGGSAKAIAYIIQKHQIPLTVINRSPLKLKSFESMDCRLCVSDEWRVTEDYDLVINATTAGLDNDLLPLDSDRITTILESMQNKDNVLVYDIVYGRVTPLFALAQSLNVKVVDGFEMLMMQAALSATYFAQAIDSALKIDREECYNTLASFVQ